MADASFLKLLGEFPGGFLAVGIADSLLIKVSLTTKQS